MITITIQIDGSTYVVSPDTGEVVESADTEGSTGPARIVSVMNGDKSIGTIPLETPLSEIEVEVCRLLNS